MNAHVRPIVEEHRITNQLIGIYTIRYWIESDPAFGGKSWTDAQADIFDAEAALYRMYKDEPNALTTRLIANILFKATRAINSIEVCDTTGHGVCLHRNWP